MSVDVAAVQRVIDEAVRLLIDNEELYRTRGLLHQHPHTQVTSLMYEVGLFCDATLHGEPLDRPHRAIRMVAAALAVATTTSDGKVRFPEADELLSGVVF